MIWFIGDSPIKDDIISEMTGLSDRVVGLLLPVFIDEELREAIKAQWQDDGKVIDQLLRDGGPIGSLSTLIDLGFVTKLYSQVVRRDLRQIVKIRNAFAHKLGATSFDSPEIKSRANELKLPSLYPLTNPIEDFTEDVFNSLLGEISAGNWRAVVTLLTTYGSMKTNLDSLRDSLYSHSTDSADSH